MFFDFLDIGAFYELELLLTAVQEAPPPLGTRFNLSFSQVDVESFGGHELFKILNGDCPIEVI